MNMEFSNKNKVLDLTHTPLSLFSDSLPLFQGSCKETLAPLYVTLALICKDKQLQAHGSYSAEINLVFPLFS